MYVIVCDVLGKQHFSMYEVLTHEQEYNLTVLDTLSIGHLPMTLISPTN